MPHTANRMSSSFFSSERAKSFVSYSPRRLDFESMTSTASSLGLKSWRCSWVGDSVVGLRIVLMILWLLAILVGGAKEEALLSVATRARADTAAVLNMIDLWHCK